MSSTIGPIPYGRRPSVGAGTRHSWKKPAAGALHLHSVGPTRQRIRNPKTDRLEGAGGFPWPAAESAYESPRPHQRRSQHQVREAVRPSYAHHGRRRSRLPGRWHIRSRSVGRFPPADPRRHSRLLDLCGRARALNHRHLGLNRAAALRRAAVGVDGDFHRLSLLHGAPPKVVWLRIGNCSTTHIARLLTEHAEDIRTFDVQSDATVLELG